MRILGLVVLVLAPDLFSPAIAGIGLPAPAFRLMVWARLTFGLRSLHLEATPTAGGLVTHGPYRWLRHPIYAAVIWFAIGGVVCNPLIFFGMAGLFLIIASAALRRRSEETLLRVTYPAYADHASRTNRVLPFVI